MLLVLVKHKKSYVAYFSVVNVSLGWSDLGHMILVVGRERGVKYYPLNLVYHIEAVLSTGSDLTPLKHSFLTHHDVPIVKLERARVNAYVREEIGVFWSSERRLQSKMPWVSVASTALWASQSWSTTQVGARQGSLPKLGRRKLQVRGISKGWSHPFTIRSPQNSEVSTKLAKQWLLMIKKNWSTVGNANYIIVAILGTPPNGWGLLRLSLTQRGL